MVSEMRLVAKKFAVIWFYFSSLEAQGYVGLELALGEGDEGVLADWTFLLLAGE